MTEQLSLIEQGVRQKVRFQTSKGLLTTEDLFDLPLEQPCRSNAMQQPDKAKQPVANLDEIAVELDNQLQSTSKSFVRTKSKESTLTELKLEIVKYVIKIKVAEQEAKEKATLQAKLDAIEEQRLLESLDKKQNAKYDSLSEEELLAKLNSLKK